MEERKRRFRDPLDGILKPERWFRSPERILQRLRRVIANPSARIGLINNQRALC
jgi:hypothetical protein